MSERCQHPVAYLAHFPNRGGRSVPRSAVRRVRRHRVIFERQDRASRGLKHGDLVDIAVVPEGGSNQNERVMRNLTAVAYHIAQGSIAAYYPEANVLVALDHYDAKSGTPSYKSAPVLLQASSRNEALRLVRLPTLLAMRRPANISSRSLVWPIPISVAVSDRLQASRFSSSMRFSLFRIFGISNSFANCGPPAPRGDLVRALAKA
jgi:hypothetical protein